jgi:hypothetical protein
MRPTKSVGANPRTRQIDLVSAWNKIRRRLFLSLSLSPQKKEKTIFYLNYFWGFGGEVCGNLEQLCGSPGSHVFGVSWPRQLPLYLSISFTTTLIFFFFFFFRFFFLPKLPQTLCLLHRNDLIGWLLSSLIFFAGPEKKKVNFSTDDCGSSTQPTHLSFFLWSEKEKERKKRPK